MSDTPLHRVLVVDDHTVLADLMANAIDSEHDVECVGVAGDLSTAAELAAALDPDTVLLDACLPSGDGIDLIPQLRDIRPDVRVILLTAQPRPDRARAAFAHGAVGYLGKDARLADVLLAVRHASADRPARDPRLSVRCASPASRWMLSPREQEVLEHLASGKHVQDIALQLGLSIHTTRDYVKALLKKMGARSQLEAVTLAAREGLVQVGRR